jgi:hypothetical protein
MHDAVSFDEWMGRELDEKNARARTSFNNNNRSLTWVNKSIVKLPISLMRVCKGALSL